MSALTVGGIISAMLGALWVGHKCNARFDVICPLICVIAVLIVGGNPTLTLLPYAVLYGFRKRSSVAD